MPPATEATPTRALAKIGGFAKSASPFVRAVMGYADAAVEDWLESRLGEEFRTIGVEGQLEWLGTRTAHCWPASVRNVRVRASL